MTFPGAGCCEALLLFPERRAGGIPDVGVESGRRDLSAPAGTPACPNPVCRPCPASRAFRPYHWVSPPISDPIVLHDQGERLSPK